MPSTRRCCTDHGLSALLGDRDACRRLPLRPGLRPGPRAPRRRSPGVLLRRHPSGPSPQPGEADRGAWDIAEGGYQVGNFPTLWSEWNDKYRDTVRDYWKAGDVSISELAYRLTGSSDLYQGDGRRPYASINFVTAHDGFTLHDLVSYNEKHNEANGENNRDGHDHNLSWNHGVEGPTKDPKIIAAREQTKRNLMATLLLSQGVPMLAHGDEIGRTQRGNNNVYAQDNEISWVDWNLDKRKRAFLEFTRNLIAVRDAHPSLGRPRFFQGRRIRGSPVEGPGLVPPGRPADDRRGVGRGVGTGHRHAPRR